MNYKFSEISQIIEAEKTRLLQDGSIYFILTDSRKVFLNEGTMFVAISSKKNNGHKYIEEVYKKGIRNFLVEFSSFLVDECEKYPKANFLFVQNSLKALQKIAAFHRQRFNIPLVAITGSNGKTMAKEWLHQALQPFGQITKSPKSYNSQLGVPLSLLLIDDNTDLAIIEAGISMMNEMEKLQEIIQPSIGIITNIGDAHQENFISYEQKANEKLKLFKNCHTVFFPADNAFIEKNIRTLLEEGKTKFYKWSIINKTADLFIQRIIKSNTSTNIIGVFENQIKEILIPFTDQASIENCILVWLFLLWRKMDDMKIYESMLSLTPIEMRLELLEGIGNCTLINDCYNADLYSLQIALDFLEQQKQHDAKTLIMSDLSHGEKDEASFYQYVSNIIQKAQVNKFVGVGGSLVRNSDFFRVFHEASFYHEASDLLNNISQEKFKNQTILIKGSRSFAFEKISSVLQKKTHRTVLEINLTAIEHNLNYYKSLIKPETKLMAMVKAFCYGSGTFEIANLLQHLQVDYLAVAYPDEGLELRKTGTQLPIMVMSPEVDAFELMIENNLEPEIHSFEVLQSFLCFARKNSCWHFPVHIKIDTGMHRLGFEEFEIEEMLNQICQDETLEIKSIFSHLAGSDDSALDYFTHLQIEKFTHICEIIETRLERKVIKHILNSAGIERFANAQWDMVRLGIGLYGISALNHQKLKNISSLKTRVIQIRKTSKDETIGYNRKGIVQRDSIIATISIGYADGLSRKLGNGKGKVIINGKTAPIIGNICMDMCMVDVTDMDVRIGDVAILFGDELPVSEVAKALDTIAYEVLTGVSQRVKKLYFME